jgi:hypothetical protein
MATCQQRRPFALFGDSCELLVAGVVVWASAVTTLAGGRVTLVVGAGPHTEGALVVGEIAPAAWIHGQDGQGVGSTGLTRTRQASARHPAWVAGRPRFAGPFICTPAA